MTHDEIKKAIERNIHWKKELNWSYADVIPALNSRNVQVESPDFVKEVANFQRLKGVKDDGILGPATYQLMIKKESSTKEQALKLIVDKTIAKESGGRYDAMNLDGEFAGKFDKVWIERHSRKHPASGTCHIGLSFGIIQFTQDGGSLGKLLRKCAQANPERFKQVFGPTWDQLLSVLTAEGKSGFAQLKLRGPRVQQIPITTATGVLERKDIWEKPWTDKFKAFGGIPEFQAMQRELAIEEYLVPILPTLKEKGWFSEKAVAAAFDGSVHRGVAGMKSALNSTKAKDEKGALQELASRDPRRATIINDAGLSWNRWAGWDFMG